MPKAEPLRTCLVTREELGKDDLLRFVIAPDGALVHDITGKLPGRGLYIGLSKPMLAEAMERKLFSKAAKQPIHAPEAFEDVVEKHLRDRVLQALSLARKAGDAVAGFDKCMAAIQSDAVACMLHASDAGNDGIRKLSPRETPFSSTIAFTRDELSQVMGGGNTVHVAVLIGASSQFFLKQLRRFALFIEKTPL